jgi:hypothetical protein
MNTATFNKNKSELAIMSICDFIESNALVKKPTICLIILCDDFIKKHMTKVINAAIDIGTIFFMSYGYFAHELHDFIDEIIESSCYDLTHIVTTAHQNERATDIAQFFINSTYFEDDSHRYIMLFDKHSLNADILQRELLLLFEQKS